MEDWNILLSLIMMITVMAFAYITTVFLASRMQMSSKTKHLKVVDQLILDKDKRIVIVEIAQRFHVLAFSANHVENLGLIEDFGMLVSNDSNHSVSFKNILATRMTQWRKRDE
jgi:flagellar biogenesis protein FliO